MLHLRERIRAWRAARRRSRVTYEQACARVARGAAYLDEVAPGWYRRIDAETLALADGSCCVLGQLHGAYRNGLYRAHLFNPSSAPRANLSPVGFGFHCVQLPDPALQELDYAYLDRAWRAEIGRRQAQEQPPRRRARRTPRPVAPPPAALPA